MSKRRIHLTLCEYELSEMDELAARLGLPSRSRLVNIVLQRLLSSTTPGSLSRLRKREVRLMIDGPNLNELNEVANDSHVLRTDLLRFALRNFKERYTRQK